MNNNYSRVGQEPFRVDFSTMEIQVNIRKVPSMITLPPHIITTRTTCLLVYRVCDCVSMNKNYSGVGQDSFRVDFSTMEIQVNTCKVP